jgi:DNA-binding NtrC family response regulator
LLSRDGQATLKNFPSLEGVRMSSEPTRKSRVLMVDDDQEYLGVCTIIFRDDGHHVTACSDFNEGRRQLAEDHFDALIADVRLGAYNGLHLIALAAPSMIKIALSAFFDPVIRRDAERAGAKFFLKPADCASISALLSQTE